MFSINSAERLSGVIAEWIGNPKTKRSEAPTGYSQAACAVNKNDLFGSSKSFAITSRTITFSQAPVSLLLIMIYAAKRF
jgi:hypothetical protein